MVALCHKAHIICSVLTKGINFLRFDIFLNEDLLNNFVPRYKIDLHAKVKIMNTRVISFGVADQPEEYINQK